MKKSETMRQKTTTQIANLLNAYLLDEITERKMQTELMSILNAYKATFVFEPWAKPQGTKKIVAKRREPSHKAAKATKTARDTKTATKTATKAAKAPKNYFVWRNGNYNNGHVFRAKTQKQALELGALYFDVQKGHDYNGLNCEVVK